MKNPISKWVLALIIVSMFFMTFSEKKWNEEGAVINHDVVSYYSYLPVVFIYKDLSLDFVYHRKEGEKFIIWPMELPDGKKVIKTTMGVSYFYAPFFFMAHLYSKSMGLETDGYSMPYCFALAMSVLFYFSLSMLLLRKFLISKFSDLTVAITLLSIITGTNLLHYAAYDIPMSHIFSFFLFTCFLVVTDKWHQNQKISISFILGLTIGCIALIRPTDALIIILFIFWGINSFQDFVSKMLFFLRNYFHLLVMIVVAFLVFVPQFVYWKMATGNYLVYSYGEEGFFFDSPNIFLGLFAYRNGWILYSPMVIFCISGLFFIRKKVKDFFIPSLIFIPLNIYIILSWWCWWYTGFGNRPFVNSYPVLAVLLAAFLSWCFGLKSYKIKIPILILFASSIGLSIYHTVLFYDGTIHYNSMTKEAYWEAFAKGYGSNQYWASLREPDYDKSMHESGIFYLDERNKDFKLICDMETYDTTTQELLSADSVHVVEGFSTISREQAFSGTHSAKVEGGNISLEYRFIVCEGETYRCSVYRKKTSSRSCLVVDDKNQNTFSACQTTDNNSTNKDWEKLEVTYVTPRAMHGNKIRFFVSNEGTEPVYFDNFVVERIDGTAISCEVEQLNETGSFFLGSGNNNLFTEVLTWTKKEAFSGYHSVKTNSEMLYSLAHEILVVKGQKIKISVWRKSKSNSGFLVLSGPHGQIIATKDASDIDKKGWGKLTLEYTVPPELDRKSLKIFVYNPSDVDAYFDSMKIEFLKGELF